MFRRAFAVFAASISLAACNLASKEDLTYDDSRNPHYKQAQQDLDAGNASAAAADYEAALADDSKLAQAHYELGVLYAEKLSDPVSSIYHYKRFLELAPGSDKADTAKDQIDKEGQAFATSLPGAPASANADELARLQAENSGLEKQVADAKHTIAQLQAKLAHHHHSALAMTPPAPEAQGGPDSSAPMLAETSATNAPAAGPAANGSESPSPTPTNVAPAVPPRAVAVDTNSPDVNSVPPAAESTNTAAAPAGPARSYTVVKGDSLWKIAHKMYPGDTKNGEDKIRDANKDVFAGKFLKPGQVLIIP